MATEVATIARRPGWRDDVNYYQCFMSISAFAARRGISDQMVSEQKERAEQDAIRTIGMETGQTAEEVKARYGFRWGPFEPMTFGDDEAEADDGAESRSKFLYSKLTVAPLAKPQPDAVATLLVDIPGGDISPDSLSAALYDLRATAKGEYPQELRLAPADYTDYMNLMTGYDMYLGPVSAGSGRRLVYFCGIPLEMMPRQPKGTLRGVFPLRGR